MEVLTVILYSLLGLCFYLIGKDLLEKSTVGYRTAKNYPGYFIYPIVGNLPQLASLSPEQVFVYSRTSAENFKETFREWVFGIINLNVIRAKDAEATFNYARKSALKFKATYQNWLFGNIELNIIRAKEAEMILSSLKHYNKSDIYLFLHSFLGTGLLTSSGKKWQQRRRILTPTFHFNILEHFFRSFKEETTILLQFLGKEANKPEGTNLLPVMSRTALNTICETAFGVKLETMAQPDVYRQKIYEIGMNLLYRLMRPWLHPDFLFRLSGKKAQLDAMLKPAHEFTKNIINQRRTQFYESRAEFEDMVNENVYVSTKRRFAMLDTLLAAEERGEIDSEGIREEVDTFTFEGHDTTSAGLTFSLLLIALHPTIQTRCFEEISEIVDNRDIADLMQADFNEMKYLERVIKECLRIYPPVPFISRELSEDLMTEKGLVPKGAQIHIHIYDLHRDPEQFPDPEKFDPDRFLPENCENRHPYAYIPFSAGPRNCIGQKFAMLELKTIMSSVLLKFKLKPITQREDIVFIADLVLRSRNPVKIKFEAR